MENRGLWLALVGAFMGCSAAHVGTSRPEPGSAAGDVLEGDGSAAVAPAPLPADDDAGTVGESICAAPADGVGLDYEATPDGDGWIVTCGVEIGAERDWKRYRHAPSDEGFATLPCRVVDTAGRVWWFETRNGAVRAWPEGGSIVDLDCQ